MPRAGLTPDAVVQAAARLADDVGWDHLTLAALAARLGVAVPSLYKHVDGLDAVRRGVTLLAIGEMAAALEAALAPAIDGGSSMRLSSMAAAYRAYARQHPGRYAAIQRAAPPDDADLAVESAALVGIVLAVLAERGLTGDAAIDAARALRSALHGFVVLEALGGFGLPRDIDRSFARMIEVLDLGFTANSLGSGA
ncbi:MAG: WHG domain-containing protein [Chloroflexota bacterium]|nr:WHG domain-containing protein [Chloroflexota bacterium]